MTRARKACISVIVLVSGLALATSTRPVTVGSVVSNATPIERPSVGVLFASTGTAARPAATTATSTAQSPHPHHSAQATAGSSSIFGHPAGDPVSPAEFFDRK
jgi:hypothetical protein